MASCLNILMMGPAHKTSVSHRMDSDCGGTVVAPTRACSPLLHATYPSERYTERDRISCVCERTALNTIRWYVWLSVWMVTTLWTSK